MKFSFLKACVGISFIFLQLGINHSSLHAQDDLTNVFRICSQTQSTLNTACGTPIDNDHIRVLADCENMEIPINVLVLNIGGLGQQNIDGSFSWPSQFPPLYIKYEYDENIYHVDRCTC